MKKHMIMITVMSAVACLTGCGADINVALSPAAENSAATGAVTTTATQAGSTEETTAATTSSADSAAENTNSAAALGKCIFGGSVTADTAVKSKADANSETLLTIPDGTQISVYESGISGWFMTNFKDTVGYIPANSVKDIPPFDPAVGGDNVRAGSVTANVKVMSGTHAYATVLIEIPSGTQINYYVIENDTKWAAVNFKDNIGYIETKYIKEIESYDPAASVLNVKDLVGEWYYLNPDSTVGSVIEITADGKFSETIVANNILTTGTVKAEKDGYSFYDSENHPYLAFSPDPKNPKEFLDSNPEDGRLVSANDYNKPNAEGFYDTVLLPITSVSVAALSGTWKNADNPDETVEISEGRSLNHGRFILNDASGNEVRGDVRIQYLVNQGGIKEYCFTFYEDSGKFRFALDVTDTIQLTDLYGYQSGTPHFVRQ